MEPIEEPITTTQDVLSIITSSIRIATPKNTFRGRKERDKLARKVISNVKQMMYDRRMKHTK